MTRVGIIGWFCIALAVGSSVGIATSWSVAFQTNVTEVVVGSGVAAGVTVTLAACSILVAMITSAATDRRTRIEFFLEVARVFKTEKMREQRKALYDLAEHGRTECATWEDDEIAAIRDFCGNLDLIAVLANARQVDMQGLLQMYGDVIFRTFYVSAPVIRILIEEGRGHHHLVPIRTFIPTLHRAWAKAVKSDARLRVIGFPDGSLVKLTPETYLDDPAIKAVIFP